MKLKNNLYFYPESAMLDCNTYVITGGAGIIVDPGAEMFLESLLEGMKDDGIAPEDIGLIINTHLHGDHCGANEAFKGLSGASIAIHPVQKKYYEMMTQDLPRSIGMPPVAFKEDILLEDGSLGAEDPGWELVCSPGHSPSCVCFYSPQEKVLICGDVVFEHNTGRVDFIGGDAATLKQSIERLAQLEVDYLLPGHMDVLTGAERVKQNFDFIRRVVFEYL
jgi:hydroxyacylglutathione hydrolase